ncbi:AAA family ATPase [Patescibacteria group bacterium]
MKTKQLLIVGLVGLPGAGKSTAATFLEKQRFYHITLSDLIKQEARKAGINKYTREMLQNYGNKMRETYGPQILAQLALKKAMDENKRKVVIDGIRNLYEVAFLGVEHKFSLIGITAPSKTRYERVRKRKGKVWTGTYDNFLLQEKREGSLGSKAIGLRVKDCLKKSDITVKNSKTEREFIDSLDALIKTIRIQNNI